MKLPLLSAVVKDPPPGCQSQILTQHECSPTCISSSSSSLYFSLMTKTDPFLDPNTAKSPQGLIPERLVLLPLMYLSCSKTPSSSNCFTSISFTVWSSEVVRQYLPSDVKLTEVTGLSWGCICWMNSFCLGVQNFIDPSLCPDTINEPYGKESSDKQLENPEKDLVQIPFSMSQSLIFLSADPVINELSVCE